MQFFPLYAIAGDGVNLLGRNWLSEVKLDWAILFHRCKEELNNAVKPLNSGHVQVLNNCPLLVGNFKKIDTFGTQHFFSYFWHVRYLWCPLFGSFYVFPKQMPLVKN